MSIKEISDVLLKANEPEDVFTGSTKEEMLEYYGEERILLNLKWEKIMASLISKSKLAH